MNYRGLVSKHRSAVMGLMAIIIVLYHARLSTSFTLYNATIGRFGSTAVDVFVFVSGFGLAYSLRKHAGFGEYYARRLERVLPSWYANLLCSVLLALVLILMGQSVNIPQFVLPRLVPIGVWVNYRVAKWYIPASLGFYVIAAVLHPAMRRSRYLYLTTAAMLFLTAWYVPVLSRMSNVSLVIDRVPGLVVGLAVGEAAQRDEPRYKSAKLGLAGLTLLFAMGLAMFLLAGRLTGPILGQIAGSSHIRLRQTLMASLICVVTAGLFEAIDRIRLDFVVR